MKMLSIALATAALAAPISFASADTRIVELWTCTLEADKSLADVQAVNAKWLKFVNGRVQGGDVRSSIAMPVVGDASSFMFFDSFPSFEAWTAAKAALATPEGAAVEAEVETAAECTSNTLHRVTDS